MAVRITCCSGPRRDPSPSSLIVASACSRVTILSRGGAGHVEPTTARASKIPTPRREVAAEQKPRRPVGIPDVDIGMPNSVPRTTFCARRRRAYMKRLSRRSPILCREAKPREAAHEPPADLSLPNLTPFTSRCPLIVGAIHELPAAPPTANRLPSLLFRGRRSHIGLRTVPRHTRASLPYPVRPRIQTLAAFAD